MAKTKFTSDPERKLVEIFDRAVSERKTKLDKTLDRDLIKYPKPKDEWAKKFIESWIKQDAVRLDKKYGPDLPSDVCVAIVKEELFRAEAVRLVHLALEEGLLKQEACRICDDPWTQAHHEDYSKPLDVIWLCRRCHGVAHSMIRNEVNLLDKRQIDKMYTELYSR